MSISTAVLILLAMSVAAMALAWVFQYRTRDAGIIDVVWTGGLGLGAALFLAVDGGWMPRKVLVALLVSAWAWRLCAYILKDRVLAPGEDRRYWYLRAHWGDKANRNFFILFQAETVLIVLFALPFLAAMLHPAQGFRAWDLAGVLLWLAAVGGETVADRQLAAFRADPVNQGRTCRQGLWRYSRHPNYFFEWLHWWAYVLVAAGSPYFAWSLLGPACMFVFLFFITGIPYTEQQALRSRPDYADYRRTTSMFFPWFPRPSM